MMLDGPARNWLKGLPANPIGSWAELKKYPSEDIYVIGGESVYRQLLDACDVAYITKDDYTYSADTFFPNLDELPEWELTERSEEQTYFDLIYHFLKYEKREKQS